MKVWLTTPFNFLQVVHADILRCFIPSSNFSNSMIELSAPGCYWSPLRVPLRLPTVQAHFACLIVPNGKSKTFNVQKCFGK